MLPIALQLYSVRNEAAQDLMGVLDRVAAMGYDGVEFAGYYGHSPEAIRSKLDALGLKAEGTHTALDALQPGRFDETVALHKTLGCEYVIVPSIPKERRNTAAACASTAGELTELTRKIEDVGLRLGFHAHGDDMDALDNGKAAYHMIGEGTPSGFIMQYDTANGMSGGADPVQPIKDFPGRTSPSTSRATPRPPATGRSLARTTFRGRGSSKPPRTAAALCGTSSSTRTRRSRP